MLLGLEIDSAYRSRFKSPSEGIKLYHKLARTAAPANLPVPPTKLDDPHISAGGRV
jgi:hypothetical protein